MVFKKPILKAKAEEPKPAPKPTPKVVEEKPKAPVSREGLCVEEGCSNPLAPGQTYVCEKHIRRG